MESHMFWRGGCWFVFLSAWSFLPLCSLWDPSTGTARGRPSVGSCDMHGHRVSPALSDHRKARRHARSCVCVRVSIRCTPGRESAKSPGLHSVGFRTRRPRGGASVCPPPTGCGHSGGSTLSSTALCRSFLIRAIAGGAVVSLGLLKKTHLLSEMHKT